jgi:hypothetical protein
MRIMRTNGNARRRTLFSMLSKIGLCVGMKILNLKKKSIGLLDLVV